MTECVFCKIVAGEIPCHRVDDDDLTIAFMDIGQVNPGHVIVAVKSHAETLMDLTPDQAGAALRTARRIARAVEAAFEPEGITLLQANRPVGEQTVPHFHLHVVPRHTGDGMAFTWPTKHPPNEELAAYADQTRVRVILWDVDGTLVQTGGVGAEAFSTAIETLYGVPAGNHGVSLAGKTDPQIAREILTVLELHDDAEARLPGLLAETERLVAAGRDRIRERGVILPGVPALLEGLQRSGAVQTVLTGNTAANAAVKLDAFDLPRWLDLEVGAYGSDDADRNALVEVALARVERTYGRVDRSGVWVIGDTPLDAACAKAGGVHCLLVATGFAPRAALNAANADHVVDDLTDTEAVLALLA